jgi:glycosyltransferase involved in cell wall biosynthesis
MVNVLYLPLNAGGPNDQIGMLDAFRAVGANLSVFDFYLRWNQTRSKHIVESEFIAAVKRIQPDLVHMQLQLTGLLTPECIVAARMSCPQKKIIFTNWSGDVRNDANKHIVALSRVIDYTLLSSTGQIALYQAAGAQNVRYWQNGIPPRKVFPKFLPTSSFKYYVSFTGNKYSANAFLDAQKRSDLIERLKVHYKDKFGLFGTGYPQGGAYGRSGSLDPNAMNDVFNISHCLLSISNYNDISHYFSDRMLACIATARPTISYRFPGFQSYFANGSDILIVNNLEDIIKCVDFCVANPEKANQIGLNGYRKAISEHTLKSRIIELLQIVGLSNV